MFSLFFRNLAFAVLALGATLTPATGKDEVPLECPATSAGVLSSTPGGEERVPVGGMFCETFYIASDAPDDAPAGTMDWLFDRYPQYKDANYRVPPPAPDTATLGFRPGA